MSYHLTTVISGGQTGVDQAALYAAKLYGLKVGGMMPSGYRTLVGKWRWAQYFGMSEHPSNLYPPRTEHNVLHSDATVQIASDFTTAGELCTSKLITKHRKPFVRVIVKMDGTFNTEPDRLARWLRDKEVWTLNVAGNSEGTSPGIGMLAAAYLTQVFSYIVHDWF